MSDDLTPVRWEVRASGDDEPASFTDREVAATYADELHARRPHVQILITGFTDDDFPAADAVRPPRVGEEARKFLATTEKSGGSWQFADAPGTVTMGDSPPRSRPDQPTARLAIGPHRYLGRGDTLDAAVLDVRDRFRRGESRSS